MKPGTAGGPGPFRRHQPLPPAAIQPRHLYRPGLRSRRRTTAEYLILTATEDTLTVVEFDGKNKAGELKSADQALSEEMRTAKLYGPNVFLPAIVKKF